MAIRIQMHLDLDRNHMFLNLKGKPVMVIISHHRKKCILTDEMLEIKVEGDKGLRIIIETIRFLNELMKIFHVFLLII